MPSKRILVVDDQQEITDLVATMLGSHDYNCYAADSGQECLEMLRKQKFDLVLLDLAMPGMSGLDVLSSLGENPETRPHNIVIFTASPEYTEQDLKKVTKWCPAIERVNKPFNEDSLFAVIDKYLK